MVAVDNDNGEPAFRFKRRKIAHSRRVRPDEDESSTATLPLDADVHATPAALLSRSPSAGPEASVPNLREILRNRKRPRDRLREAARRVESSKSVAVAPVDAPKPDQYATRFVAQTGQVIDQDDRQMMEYVEARTAEKNHRLYGWPIPRHLKHMVADLEPATEQNGVSTAPGRGQSRSLEERSLEDVKTDYSHRLAAGMGKLQEIDLGPETTAQNVQRTEEARRRLETGQAAVAQAEPPKIRLGRDGKPRRARNTRNSEDLRRDMMVEAVLREARLDYFEEDATPPPSGDGDGNGNTDEALVEQFRREFLESMEPRVQKKPAPPPGPKGAKEPPKGPKLGGSRSARAAMRLQEEQASKTKR